jgi:putative glutamine amidotransferase
MANPSFANPPIIGVTTRRGDPQWVKKNTQNYLNLLAYHGATAVILAPDTPAHLPNGHHFTPSAEGRLPDELLAHLDGVIFSGGGDVHPKHFGQPLNGAEPESIDLLRDELELHLGRAALAQDLPIWGICRGCQVLNVAAGGGMVQHLEGHRPFPDGRTRYHVVELRAGSRVLQMVGQTMLTTNSFHHQGMDQASLAPIFTASGVAATDRWLVEAYESPAHRWVVGVQWHPERIFELEEGHRRLWEGFLKACRR